MDEASLSLPLPSRKGRPLTTEAADRSAVIASPATRINLRRSGPRFHPPHHLQAQRRRRRRERRRGVRTRTRESRFTDFVSSLTPPKLISARVSEGSESFPIIAGLARQRSLPTKAEKPQPDINLIVSGYGARVTSSSKKAGPFKPLVKPSKASSSLNARTPPTPTSQKPVSTTPSRPSPNSSEEPPPVPTVGAAVIEDDTSQPPPRTPSPPPLVRPSASGYASSAVTTLKTPTNTWRANAESSTPTTRTHAQLLEDMVANVPQGYNLHEQGDNATETDQILPSAPAHAFHDGERGGVSMS